MPTEINRRTLLTGLGFAAAFTAVGVSLPTAEAVALPPIRDTFQGLLAFLVPGGDRFSRHQGVTSETTGGVDALAAPALEYTYDQAIPYPLVGRPFDLNLPGAAAVAAILNITASAVNPGSNFGPFAAAFANLKYAEKAEVLRRLERPGLADGTPVRFLINTIPTLAAFAVYSEAPVFDRTTHQLTRRPVGWDLSGYAGVSDGWAEFQGYYRGVDRVTD
ncbi:hypothetical protein [Actinokineospora spheciospongiae]|uniref:hypothetical protein n=1 Tax=Actinokineospora spheciospongiae TaxID=909613 RepID=UPI000D7177D2|nr:hypothetical protein [Actinokineospora spheciospongiae]PWW59437.1 hypothetical protein DFQ13_10874 [Actinokineospora spheciospongiae]